MFVRTVVLLAVGHMKAHLLKEWARTPVPDSQLVCISRFPIANYSRMLPCALAGQSLPDEMQADLQKVVAPAGATLSLADLSSADRRQRVLHFGNVESLEFDMLSIGAGSIPAGLPEKRSVPGFC